MSTTTSTTATAAGGNVAATAAATSAASGFTGKAKRPMIQTPASAVFPSEIPTPLSATPGGFKRDDFNTPISPPTAYTDFLKTMSPGLMSPPNSSGSLSRFPSADSAESIHTTVGERRDSGNGTEKKAESNPAQDTHPPITRNSSTDSSASYSTVSTSSSAESIPTATAGPSRPRPKPLSPRIIIPPPQFARPASARTPRRLHIPHSPFSATSVRSPMSARSMQSLPSPYTTSALSAGPWSASFSPRQALSPRVDEGRRRNSVSVRQVTTTTYTYRKPLEPAPRGKRRKTASEEPPEITPTQDSQTRQGSDDKGTDQKMQDSVPHAEAAKEQQPPEEHVKKETS